MKIAITTPTGHIGGKVAELLHKAGAKLRLLLREPGKAADLVRRGAEVRQGSLDDADYFVRATKGVDALFLVIPPNYTTDDVRGFQNRVGQAAARAVRENKIPRVVFISSIGAQLDSGTGPIAGLHDVEKLLDEACENVTHLRCGYFFENFLMQLDSIRRDACFYLPVSESVRKPMVATADIAKVAAERLLDPGWKGRCIRGVHGPKDLSLEEAAEEISRGLGHEVRFVEVPEEMVRGFMHSKGLSDAVIDCMLEMYRAADAGLLKPAEPRSAETTTPTTLRQFARDVIAPAIAAPAEAHA